MKVYHLFFALLFLAASCTISNKKEQSYLLTYSADVLIISDTVDEAFRNYLRNKNGDSIRVIYDHRGNIRMNYYGTGDYGFQYNMFNAKEKRLYAKFNNRDTLYYFNTAVNSYPEDSIVKSKSSLSITVKCYSIDKSKNQQILQKFQFIKDSLVVDTKLYEGFQDLSFGKIIAKGGRLPIKSTETTSLTKFTKQLIRVKTTDSPDESYFKPNESLPLKNMN